MYLTEPAIDATLNTVLGFPKGSEIVLTFVTPERRHEQATLPFPSRTPPEGGTPSADPGATSGTAAPPAVPPGATLATMAAAAGEPWLTFYEPEEIERKLRHAGFADVFLVTPEIANERYFSGRPDALPPPRRTQLLSATV